MRSTIAAEERYEEGIVQPFSWDRKKRPALAPVSWEGEEWKEFPGTSVLLLRRSLMLGIELLL
jgi:hypothetical protein